MIVIYRCGVADAAVDGDSDGNGNGQRKGDVIDTERIED